VLRARTLRILVAIRRGLSSEIISRVRRERTSVLFSVLLLLFVVVVVVVVVVIPADAPFRRLAVVRASRVWLWLLLLLLLLVFSYSQK